ncbi:MAG: hypothetical protein OXG44_17430 [Gammaproteobacteria bacterium]|nr:hypothetical protein [Gammaproteobacteria bacterium]
MTPDYPAAVKAEQDRLDELAGDIAELAIEVSEFRRDCSPEGEAETHTAAALKYLHRARRQLEGAIASYRITQGGKP